MQISYTFNKTHSLKELTGSFEGKLKEGEQINYFVSVAGRVMLLRRQGGTCFATLHDETGSIQLFFKRDTTQNFAELSALRLGDWIGAKGNVVRTKRGELSVLVESWELLAKARKDFGDKYHGITHLDFRYRHREIDLWVNKETREVFVKRHKIISLLRKFLTEKGYTEVETPILHPIPGGALARPFVTHYRALDQDYYLRIAPELYLKRLVVGGFEKIFEIGRVFRNEGLSTKHNPEFTILELYCAYEDYFYLMDLTEEIFSYLLSEVNPSSKIPFDSKEIYLSPPFRRISFEEIISKKIQKDVSISTEVTELRAICDEYGIAQEESWGSGKLLLELYEKLVEPEIVEPTFVIDYPKEVSPLARDHRRKSGLVERFELVVLGKEIANAFSELNDPDEQKLRFEAQAMKREQGDAEAMCIDEDYLFALEHGLPPTAGLGIGIDRLVILLTGASSIREVLLFPSLKSLNDGTGND